MSKLHIIMPVLNCLEMSKGAFNSIESSKSWSFHLVDQESSDGTQEWGEGLQNVDHPFRPSEAIYPKNMKDFAYIKNSPRIPLAAAWNQGVKKALEDPECQYIAIVNNDVVFHPKTFDHLMAFMDKTGYILVSADNIKDRMSKEVMLQMELPEQFTDYDCQQIMDWRAEGPDFSCFMISRDFVDIIGKFDENFLGAYCEDQDAHVRIRRAYAHAKAHNDLGVDAERIHAKRLSTAPYYHYASQTIVRNQDLAPQIRRMHGNNNNYYLRKWGAEHPQAMDGEGFVQPFGDASKNWRNW